MEIPTSKEAVLLFVIFNSVALILVILSIVNLSN